jgi:hypothetical protein
VGTTPTDGGVAVASEEGSARKPESKRVWERKLDDGRSIVVDEWAYDDGTPSGYTWLSITNANKKGTRLLSVSTTDCVGTIPREYFPVTVLYTGMTPKGDLMTVYNQRGKCWGVIRARGTIEDMPSQFDLSPAEKPTDCRIVGPALKSATMELDTDGVFHVVGEDDHGEHVRYDLKSWTYFQRIHYFWKLHTEADGK